jgi:hypothetical protein
MLGVCGLEHQGMDCTEISCGSAECEFCEEWVMQKEEYHACRDTFSNA